MLNINLYSTPHVRRCRFNPILKVALTVTVSVTTSGHQQNAIEFAGKPMMGQNWMLSWTSIAREYYISAIFRGIQKPLPPPPDTRMNTWTFSVQYKSVRGSTPKAPQNHNRKLTSTYSIQSHDQDNHNL